jgi:hypothetical protein
MDTKRKTRESQKAQKSPDAKRDKRAAVDKDKFRERKAVVVYNKKDDKEVLYWVGKQMSFLNTHERQNNHGRPGQEASITGFQYVPNNGIVMVKGSYTKNGEKKKLSKIVGTLADDQSKAEQYVDR